MRYFSAQYVFTNNGPPLKRAVICTEDDGTIVSLENTSGELEERHSLEFFNGIIVPGFINCHCHLELSYMKGRIKGGSGLSGFLTDLNLIRDSLNEDPSEAIEEADSCMANEGVVICADVCNSSLSFSTKKKSRIKYINLLEVFGSDSTKAQKRINEIMIAAGQAEKEQLRWQIVPHSAYSVSLPLFRLIKERSGSNRVTSFHFLESEDEIALLSGHAGPLMEAYNKLLAPSHVLQTVKNHVTAVLEEITSSGNLLLVHNTFITKEIIKTLKQRDCIYYCLCPNSNLYIGGKMPPVRILTDEKCDIIIGTDSLSSNTGLSIISELRTLQDDNPETGLGELIRWATINGARALGEDDTAGSIEPGKKPGLVLIENTDLMNMRLLPKSFARRLI